MRWEDGVRHNEISAEMEDWPTELRIAGRELRFLLQLQTKAYVILFWYARLALTMERP
jgi:hypothetical protein